MHWNTIGQIIAFSTSITICSFFLFNRFVIPVGFRAAFIANFLLASWKFLKYVLLTIKFRFVDQGYQSPLLLMSYHLLSWVVANWRANFSPCNGWRWSSIPTSWQTSLNRIANIRAVHYILCWCIFISGFGGHVPHWGLHYMLIILESYWGPNIAEGKPSSHLAFRRINMILFKRHSVNAAWCALLTS